MPNAQEAQASNEDRSLVRYVNPADPTGPMLTTLAEVEEIRRSQAFHYETSPNEEPPKPKRRPNKKKP